MNKTLGALAFVAAASLLSVPAQAEPATYKLDPSHTFVTFEIPHFGTSTNRGRFNKKEGSVTLDRAAKTGKVELTIDTTSIDTGTDAFDKHLQSKDFFNTGEHPSARFVADSISFDGDKVATVKGEFTLLGKTNPVTLTASNFSCYQNPMLKREACGGDFKASIKRSLWGMNWGLDMGVPDDVGLVIQVEGIRQ